MSPTPGWADAPMIARAVHLLDLHVWVNNHNLFILLGAGWSQLLAFSSDLHFKLNILCALLGAATVQVVFLIGGRLTGNTLAAALGAVSAMVSHSLWWHSTMLEVYTLSTLLMGAAVFFVLRYEQTNQIASLCFAVFCFGLACSNHVQMGLLSVGFLALLSLPDQRARLLRPKIALVLCASFLFGLLPFICVFVVTLLERASPAQETPTVLLTLLDQSLGGEFRQFMFPADLSVVERLSWWAAYGALFIYNFPSPALLLGIAGFLAWIRTRTYPATLMLVVGALLAQVLWSSNYFVWDMYAFALPVYVLFSLGIIIGIDWMMRRGRGTDLAVWLAAPLLFLPIPLYAVAPALVASDARAIHFVRALPQYEQARSFWDPLPYFLNPNKRDYDQVERYASALLDQLEPGSCYWGDETKLLYPLRYYYQDVLGERRDVRFELTFALLSTGTTIREQAWILAHQLGAGCTVYVPSLGPPQRSVLNHVYEFLDPSTSAARVAGLPEGVFADGFPDYRFESVEIDRADGIRIVRIVRRTP